jgi:hypothetical protein
MIMSELHKEILDVEDLQNLRYFGIWKARRDTPFERASMF